MSSVFEFIAESRDVSGKSSVRAVRRQGKVPAIIYGGSGVPEKLLLDHNEVQKRLMHEAVYSHVLDVNVDGKMQKALLKDIQRHPARPQILHMDFMRIDETHKIKMHVPIHFLNEDTGAGVKMGGVVTHAMVDVEVECLSSALPEFLEVDLAEIEIGQAVHLSDLKLPEGVEIPTLLHGEDQDHPVAQVIKTKVAKGDEEDAPEASEDEAEAE